MTLKQDLDRFDAYFRSANSVPPNDRISVPTKEWLELKDKLDLLVKSNSTADGVVALKGDTVWVNGAVGPTMTKVEGPVVDYMLYSSQIPLKYAYSKKEALEEALKKGGD